jgi:hypothetical protein
VAPQRIDYIPEIEKEIKTIMKIKVFVKNRSVFHNWKEDTPELTKEWIAHDAEMWKLKVFVKEPEQQ